MFLKVKILQTTNTLIKSKYKSQKYTQHFLRYTELEIKLTSHNL